MIAVLEKLVAKLTDRRHIHAHNFWKIAGDIARGHSVDLDECEACLAGTGKSIADLQNAAEGIRQRLSWKQSIADAATAGKERDSLEKAMVAADAELERAKAKFDDAVAPSRFKLRQIAELEQLAHLAQLDLVHKCPYENLTSEHNRLSSEIQTRRDGGNSQEDMQRLRALPIRIAELKNEIVTDPHAANKIDRAKTLEHAEKELEAITSRNAASAAELPGLEKLLASLETKMREP